MSTEITENPADYASRVAYAATPVNPVHSDVEVFTPWPGLLEARTADPAVRSGGRLLAYAREYADAMWEIKGRGQHEVVVCGEAAARAELERQARNALALPRERVLL